MSTETPDTASQSDPTPESEPTPAATPAAKVKTSAKDHIANLDAQLKAAREDLVAAQTQAGSANASTIAKLNEGRAKTRSAVEAVFVAWDEHLRAGATMTLGDLRKLRKEVLDEITKATA